MVKRARLESRSWVWAPVDQTKDYKIGICCFSAKTQLQVNFQWDDDEVHFVQDEHAELDFYNASSLKQQSAGRHVAPFGHIILIPSQPVFAFSP
jgi:hypothetical protein